MWLFLARHGLFVTPTIRAYLTFLPSHESWLQSRNLRIPSNENGRFAFGGETPWARMYMGFIRKLLCHCIYVR